MIRALPLVFALAVLAACGGEPRSPAPVPVSDRTNPSIYPVFGDAKPHPWDGKTPRHYPVHGIDVSRWQGDIDWYEVKRSGVAFAFIKATEGGDVADPMFETNWKNASRAGVPRGAYHYYYFCRSPEEQARWFFKHVPRDRSALPPVLDMEWTHKSRTCKRKPDGATVRREADKFVSMLKRHYGKTPVIYTTVDFYRDTGIGKMQGVDFWLRSVAGHPSQVYPGAKWTFWQYTGTGLVPGIKGKVDINAFSGSPQKWSNYR